MRTKPCTPTTKKHGTVNGGYGDVKYSLYVILMTYNSCRDQFKWSIVTFTLNRLQDGRPLYVQSNEETRKWMQNAPPLTSCRQTQDGLSCPYAAPPATHFSGIINLPQFGVFLPVWLSPNNAALVLPFSAELSPTGTSAILVSLCRRRSRRSPRKLHRGITLVAFDAEGQLSIAECSKKAP